MFANRNHFALFLAMGCLIAPVWAFDGTHAARWRSPVAFALVLLFVLTILASGSRAGMMIGGVATGIGLLLARRGLARMLRHVPRWVVPALLVSIVGMIGGLVLVALLADRALAERIGAAGRATAQQRFGLGRFAADWNRAFATALALQPANKEGQ